MTGLIQFLKTNAFLSGLCGIALSLLLLAGLIYLFLKRNEVMTLTYGITLLSVFIFTILCLFTMLFISIYGVTVGSSSQLKTTFSKYSLTVILVLILTPFFYAQGINYPSNVPSNNGGAGNARTDADNLFTRNNAAAMTEVEDEDGVKYRGHWRVMSEFHATFYKYRREYKPIGFTQNVKSEDTVLLPSGSGEMTYTTEDRKFAFGVGLSQTFGFQSKLKDDEKVFGNQTTFFDTRVASNDMAVAAAYRVNDKVSVGGSFIVGRAFLVQTAPIQQLAQLGIIRHSRLDTNKIGGLGASLNIHFRPTEKVSFGFNFKTARKYDLEGKLESVQPVLTPLGLQLFPVKLDVKVPFKLPFIAETGVKVQPTERLFVAFDYRFYNYSDALKQINILDKSSGAIVAANTLNAKNVHLLSFGGGYKINEKTKWMFGSGFQNNALSDSAFTPALNNAGGISFSSGISRKMLGTWMNIGATAIFSLDRTIPVKPENQFPGEYRANGLTIGWGVRW